METSSVPRPAVDYRISTVLFGKRFFIAIFAGLETRSESRLLKEQQKRGFMGVVAELGGLCLMISVVLCFLLGLCVAGAYIFKSAVGIDLFEGDSVLHKYLYWW